MATSSQESFGRYELISRLGRGGMAETWRARLLGAAGVTKPVLIKKVLSEYANDQAFVAMFVSEAHISATLSHGNIAQVFDFGQMDGEYFLAMEFVDGQPLNRVIKRALKAGLGGIPVPLATFIALEMSRGLHYAHTRRDDKGRPLGIVHRDISPDNVLLSYEGQVKIVDFGIAKARALRNFHTEPGVVKGKYLFFSPEQARGEEVDARTDVWATGVVLYEMLCGQLPVTGPSYTAQPRLVKGEFPRPLELRPDLPEELDAIVMRALAVDTRERFASSHELGDALAGFLYSAVPRFSAVSIAHLLHELFGEDLKAEGREADVPRAFQEQLNLWRQPAPARPRSPPLRLRSASAPVQTRAAPAAPLPSSTDRESPLERRAPAAPAHQRRLLLGVGSGVLTLLVGAVWWELWRESQSEDQHREAVSQPKALVRPQPPAASLAAAVPPPAPSEPPPSEPPPSEPPPSEPPPSPTLSRASAVYPVASVRLVAQRDVISVPVHISRARMDLELAPHEFSAPRSPDNSPLPFYFIKNGDYLGTDESIGQVTRKPLRLRGGGTVTFFRLADATTREQSVDDQTHVVEVVNRETGVRRTMDVLPGTVASLTQAFELKGLNAGGVYELRLSPVGEGASVLKPKDGPRIRKVACARRAGEDLAHVGTDPGEFLREQHFLLPEGRPYRLSGASSLLCGFLDGDTPSNNSGEMELRILHKSGPASAPLIDGSPRPPLAGVQATPGDSTATLLYERGLKLVSKGQYKEAETLLRQCVEAHPEAHACHLMLGSAMARLGRVEEGAKHYREFVRLAPANDERLPRVKALLKAYDSSR